MDDGKVVESYRQAGNQGHHGKDQWPLRLSFFGVTFEQGSDETALEYWQRVRCDSNNTILKTISTYMLGLYYYLGFDAELDLVKGWRFMNESKSDLFVLAGQWAVDWYWDESMDRIQSSSPASKLFFEHVKLLSDNNSLHKHLEGVCYFYGFGTNKDQDKAVQIFTTLGNSGFAASQVMLGSCYFDGYVVGKSYERAVEWFRKAGDQGFADAQLCMGNCYDDAYGVPRNWRQAAKWYQKAADQGHARAQFYLGRCYLYGRDVPQDSFKAFELFRKAADQEDANAQNNLGRCYEYGHGVTRDYAAAVLWYQKAAEQGHPDAQYNLADCYRDEDCVVHDHVKAVEWYRKAAEQGHPDAQNDLAICYEDGIGVPQDIAKAVVWYYRAAEQGHVDAQNFVADCYRTFGVLAENAIEVELHRERFAAIEKASIGRTRKAILARTLKVVGDRPFLLYALLQRNLDTITDSVADSD